MTLSAEERAALLAVKGVGPTVLERLRQAGVADLADLARRDPGALCAGIAAIVGGTCWRNSPQARGSIAAAVAEAGRLTGAAAPGVTPPSRARPPSPSSGNRRGRPRRPAHPTG